LLQIRCICSKTAIARRVQPAGTTGTSTGSVWLQIRCKCSQTPPSHRRTKPETDANHRHAISRRHGQLRDGNTPTSAMHWIKGAPVKVKLGLAVGSANVVVPFPPYVVPSSENSAVFWLMAII
jgi:hypothetical protein